MGDNLTKAQVRVVGFDKGKVGGDRSAYAQVRFNEGTAILERFFTVEEFAALARQEEEK